MEKLTGRGNNFFLYPLVTKSFKTSLQSLAQTRSESHNFAEIWCKVLRNKPSR